MEKVPERRGAKRYCVNQLIKVSAMQEEYLWASAIDISLKGFSAVSPHPLEPLTQIFAMLELKALVPEDDSVTIQIEGFVAWSTLRGDHCEFGVTFSKIKNKDTKFLESWLAAHEEAADKDVCHD